MKKLKLLICAGTFMACVTVQGQSTTNASRELTMARVTSIGPEYDLLKPLTGTWNVEQKIWDDSSDVPTVIAHFIAERTLQEHFLEEVMTPLTGSGEKPFKRTSFFNFNYANYRWEYIVLDTRYPVMMFETSVDNESDKNRLDLYLPSFILAPGWIGKNGGLLAKEHRIIKFENKDKTVMQQYWTLPGGDEFLAVQYTYTRKL